MKKGVQNHSLKSSIITKALFGNVFYYSTLLCFCLLFLTGVRRTISSVKEYELEIETANMMRRMTEKYRKMCLSKSTLEEDAYRAETKQSLVIFGKKQSYKVSLLLYIFISINNLPWTSIFMIDIQEWRRIGHHCLQIWIRTLSTIYQTKVEFSLFKLWKFC